MKKLTCFLTGLILLSCLLIAYPVQAQQQAEQNGKQLVKEYKIQNLISDVLLQQFKQVNPNIQVYEHKEGNRLILVGDSLQINEALSLLELLDAQQMMVTIEFLLVEYFHNDDFEWGIDITQGKSGNFNNVNYTPAAQGGDFGFTFNAVTKLVPTFQLNLRALVAEDRAKVLTNPHLVAESGIQARLNIKDRRTLTLETATINGVTTTLQTIEAGIELLVTPVPTHDSLIHLNISGTVSEFLPFSSDGEFLIEENSINTQVDVRHGETLIIGGLILETTNELEGGIPVLKDIPLLGLLFKKKRKIRNYVERVIYITPYLHAADTRVKYEVIRGQTPLEREVETVIESDPNFLKYENTKKAKRKNGRNSRKDQNGNN